MRLMCGDCVYWEPHNEAWGCCHCDPPIPLATTSHDGYGGLRYDVEDFRPHVGLADRACSRFKADTAPGEGEA